MWQCGRVMRACSQRPCLLVLGALCAGRMFTQHASHEASSSSVACAEHPTRRENSVRASYGDLGKFNVRRRGHCTVHSLDLGVKSKAVRVRGMATAPPPSSAHPRTALYWGVLCGGREVSLAAARKERTFEIAAESSVEAKSIFYCSIYIPVAETRYSW